jgi:hypothetical protein
MLWIYSTSPELISERPVVAIYCIYRTVNKNIDDSQLFAYIHVILLQIIGAIKNIENQ